MWVRERNFFVRCGRKAIRYWAILRRVRCCQLAKGVLKKQCPQSSLVFWGKTAGKKKAPRSCRYFSNWQSFCHADEPSFSFMEYIDLNLKWGVLIVRSASTLNEARAKQEIKYLILLWSYSPSKWLVKNAHVSTFGNTNVSMFIRPYEQQSAKQSRWVCWIPVLRVNEQIDGGCMKC